MTESWFLDEINQSTGSAGNGCPRVILRDRALRQRDENFQGRRWSVVGGESANPWTALVFRCAPVACRNQHSQLAVGVKVEGRVTTLQLTNQTLIEKLHKARK